MAKPAWEWEGSRPIVPQRRVPLEHLSRGTPLESTGCGGALGVQLWHSWRTASAWLGGQAGLLLQEQQQQREQEQQQPSSRSSSSSGGGGRAGGRGGAGAMRRRGARSAVGCGCYCGAVFQGENGWGPTRSEFRNRRRIL